MARRTFSDVHIGIVHYCAQECMRQRSGEASVYNMVNAWDYALARSPRAKQFSITDIEWLGKLVEPVKNQRGFRRVPVFVGHQEKLRHDLVPRALEGLVQAQSLLEAGKLYYEFQEIHPFVDGNGRTGKILYNWKLGRLLDPIMPPNFWGIANP